MRENLESSKRWVAVALLCAWTQTWAQGHVHQKSFDRHVLRSSVVNSLSIAESSAAAHGIERSPDRGILNVTVLKKGSDLTETVPARVEARAMNLAGSRRTIPMAETRGNGWVSYTGTFSMAPRKVLDFTITAQPAGSEEVLEISFREQVWVDRPAK